MTHLRIRALARRAGITVGAVVLLLGATGCTASAAESDAFAGDESAAVTETPDESGAEAVSEEDEATCAAFGDVQTILHNAQSAFYGDRMGQQELDGWSALASRVLGSIPAAEEGRVGAALAAVQDAVPAVQEALGPSNILSREWDVPGAELLAACEAAGFPVSTTGFVGG